MASRFANWSTGTKERGLSMQSFLSELHTGGGTATDQAHQAGLHSVGYGWWADQSGQVVAQTRNGELVWLDQNQGGEGPTTAATTDMGNPTGQASGLTPADKARSMGLQSNGSGGYVDGEGNVIARTVNNELVFYDSRGSGGAVSDGSGGAILTQSQPSWIDPVTGLIITPPAQPESPEEIAATPDPVPSLAPAGFDALMNRMKRQAYEERAALVQAENEYMEQQAPIDELYASNEGLAGFKASMDDSIQKAVDSGDEYKTEVGTNAIDYMNENAQEFAEYYEMVDPSQWGELTTILKRRAIAQVKQDWWVENVETPINSDENMSDEEKRDARILARQDPETGYIGFKKLPQYQNHLNELLNPPEPEPGQPTVIQGERTQYDLTPIQLNNEGDINHIFTGLNKSEFTTIKRAANKAGKEYGIKPTEAIEIDWSRNEDPTSESDRRATALDALKTWRGQVLPELEPGVILHNSPTTGGRGNNQRERIYSLAGFGENHPKFGQFGLVVQDENGENKVVPIDFTEPSSKKKKSRKLKEEMISIVDYKLDEGAINFVYESLLL